MNFKSIIVYLRLDKVIGCRSDCDFTRLLSVPSIFSKDTDGFVQNILKYLNSDASYDCLYTFQDKLKDKYENVTADDLLSDISNNFIKHE